MVIVLVARDHLAIIFSNSKEMQEAVADLAYLLGITMVLNSVQPVISGIPLLQHFCVFNASEHQYYRVFSS